MAIIAFLKKQIGMVLLVLSCIAGLLVYKDYGISWDEPGSNEIGIINYDYIFSGDKKLLTYSEKDYGIAFELPVVIIQKICNVKDIRDAFLTRHLLTHLFFLAGAFVFFLLIDFLYRNKLLATIGFLLIVLNPLLYGHSFMNSKDIPFMSMFIFCFYLTAKAFDTKKILHFILLGIATGLLVNMRIVGIMIIACILFFLVLDIFANKKSGDRKKNMQLLLVIVITSTLTLYFSWPYLWEAPVQNFILAVKRMSKFTWYYDVLFNGRFVPSTKIGWYYIPVWFGITTPIIYLVSGCFGILFLIYRFFKKPLYFFKNNLERNNLCYLLCFFSPLLAAIALHSVLYDSWRHLFFIYPSFILMGLFGIHSLLKTKVKSIAIIGLFVAFCFSIFSIIKNHPFQYVYFNNLVDKKTPEYLRSQFEMDYWGSSYKQSLEYILEHDHSPAIYVKAENEPGWYNHMILKPEDRERVHMVDLRDATYFITNYRWHPHNYEEFKGMEIHSFKVDNNTINSIFKVK